jgi:GT2 family glycosyltransferase
MILFGERNGIFLSKPYDLHRLKLGNYIPGTAVIRREAIRRVGGFDASLTWLEDWDLWLSLAEKGLFGRLLPELLLYYRQHEDGGRNAPSPRIARVTVRRIMLKHPRLFPPLYLVMDRLEKKAQMVLPEFIKRNLRRISPRTYGTWSAP